MKEQKVYYYSDEVNDDFAGTHIERKSVPDDYEYLNKGFWGFKARFRIQINRFPNSEYIQ